MIEFPKQLNIDLGSKRIKNRQVGVKLNFFVCRQKVHFVYLYILIQMFHIFYYVYTVT